MSDEKKVTNEELTDEQANEAAGGFVWKNPGLGTATPGDGTGKTKEDPDPFTSPQPKRFF